MASPPALGRLIGRSRQLLRGPLAVTRRLDPAYKRSRETGAAPPGSRREERGHRWRGGGTAVMNCSGTGMKGLELGGRKGRADVRGSRSHKASGGLDPNQLQRPGCPGLFKPGPSEASARPRSHAGSKNTACFSQDRPPFLFPLSCCVTEATVTAGSRYPGNARMLALATDAPRRSSPSRPTAASLWSNWDICARLI